jgi:hypothetical protein
MSTIDYKRIFSKYNNPLRKQENIGENIYRVYHVDTSGNMHGSEKFYRSGVGDYPGGYCWDDLEISYRYIEGKKIAEYKYCNNHKCRPEICEAKEYNPDTNTSIAVYYNFKYMQDIHEYGIKSWTEYSFNGHYKDFVKEKYSGLVYLWEKTLEGYSTNNEDSKAILKEVQLYTNGNLTNILKKYYRNGLLYKDKNTIYNYNTCEYILNGNQEEYFSRDLSGQLCNKYYKYSNNILQEYTSYLNGKKHGSAEYYIVIEDNKKITYTTEYAEDKEVKRSDYLKNKIYNFDINNNVSIISEFAHDRWNSFSHKIKEYTISGSYLDISNMTPFSENMFIKHGPYMEWFTNAPSLFLLLRYENGQLNGPSCSFYENGTPNVSGKYINGRKTGIFSYSDLSGNKRYFNHDTGHSIQAIDLTEQYRGTSEFDSNLFAYKNLESASGSLLN